MQYILFLLQRVVTLSNQWKINKSLHFSISVDRYCSLQHSSLSPYIEFDDNNDTILQQLLMPPLFLLLRSTIKKDFFFFFILCHSLSFGLSHHIDNVYMYTYIFSLLSSIFFEDASIFCVKNKILIISHFDWLDIDGWLDGWMLIGNGINFFCWYHTEKNGRFFGIIWNFEYWYFVDAVD